MSTAITARDVAFDLPNGRTLFRHLNFTLGTNVTALVGPNGIGKSSLGRIVAQEVAPTAGQIIAPRAAAYLAQREEPPIVSVVDYLRGHPEAFRSALLHGMRTEARCCDLSGGQWMRVRLARAIGVGFIVLDEPTNNLDATGRQAVAAFIQKHRGGLLLISHDPACLALCGAVLELSSQGLAEYGDGWHSYLEARDDERRQLAASLEAAKSSRDRVKRERQQARESQEQRQSRGNKKAARGGMPRIAQGLRKSRAQATAGRVDASTKLRAHAAVDMATLAYEALKEDPIMYADLLGSALPAAKLLVEASGVNVRFDDWLYPNDLQFAWRGPMRLAIEGPNGSGKSTLLRVIVGEVRPTRGTLRLGDVSALYVDQACAQLEDARTVLENVQAITGLSETDARNGLAKFLFAKDAVFQTVATLSGGERLRALLACGFLRPSKPQFLILDEPTNNLDAANVAFLQGLVRRFPGAVVVVSHDQDFLGACSITTRFDVTLGQP